MKLNELPKSLREVGTAVRKSGSGAAFNVLNIRASRTMQSQGTRAFAGQGTASSGNTPNPLRPGQSVTPGSPPGWDDMVEFPDAATFSTDAPVAGGAPGTVVQIADWPPNRSRGVISPTPGHKEQLRSDNDLHIGPGPGRIDRQMPERVFGVTGMTTGHQGTEAGFYSMADKDYLPHVPIARQALGVKGPQKLADDNAVIPAIYAGNPRA